MKQEQLALEVHLPEGRVSLNFTPTRFRRGGSTPLWNASSDWEVGLW